MRQETKPHPSLASSRMAGDVVQGLLKDAVNMNSNAAVDRIWGSRFLVGYFNSGLPFHHWNVPVDRTLETGFIQHDRVQRLREAADFVEGGLRNLRNFP